MNNNYPPLPLYVDVHEGLDDLDEHKNSREYITNLLDVYVRDTPFRQVQIANLHEKVQSADPTICSYATSTIKRQLLKMRKDDLILLFEEHEEDLPSNRLFFWAEAIPTLAQDKLEKEELEEKEQKERPPIREVAPPSVEIRKDSEGNKSSYYSQGNPATSFFKSLFRKVLGISN